ncbi:sulfotransferase [Burkholderia sp. L27(2015)]|uniref:sulfotransferase family protein n=1 Tax=Burkholderia sp. L27(2015) TaxID=1641858 RepID=UPI0015760732|nr:sulfotransferase [Burkholderia sp. L27(2015)]
MTQETKAPSADMLHDHGCALEQSHRLEEAVLCYRQAVRLNPGADASFNNMANCLHALGRFAQAHDAYRQAIRLAPMNGSYYRNFSQSYRLMADDPCFISMSQLIMRAETLTIENRAQLHFAYGHALSDQGHQEIAFEHFLKANALKRPGVPYDEAMTLNLIKCMPDLFTIDLLRAKRGLGDPSDAAIFIIGMPRSGSTLIEQILASHPRVFGAGERPDFAQSLWRFITGDDDHAKIDIDALHTVTQAQLAQLGAEYTRSIRSATNDGANDAAHGGADSGADSTARYARIADKYPFNFIHVGMIHLALPNARFIHSRRAPVETCLSNFSRLFHDVPFSYDLGELGRYYRAYDTLMAHWRSVLPDGVMLEVRYEELVDDLEGNARRMCAHCALEWDEHCMTFHRTQRQVVTASAAQVREPLYRTSLHRWHPPATILQPLYDALGPELSGQEPVRRESHTPEPDAQQMPAVLPYPANRYAP